MQQRIQYIDLAKGLCILLVVLFHVYQHVHYVPAVIKSLSCFRMPLYFFLSGLFFKEYEGFIGFFLRKVNKLLIPFAFFYLVTSWALSNLLHYAFGGHCSYRVNRFTINPFWQYVCGMTGTLGIIITAKVIKHIPYVTYWGRYSIMILVTHCLLLKIITPPHLKTASAYGINRYIGPGCSYVQLSTFNPTNEEISAIRNCPKRRDKRLEIC